MSENKSCWVNELHDAQVRLGANSAKDLATALDDERELDLDSIRWILGKDDSTEVRHLLIRRVPLGSPRLRLAAVSSSIARHMHAGWGLDDVRANARVANLRDLATLPEGDPEGDAARAMIAQIARLENDAV